MVYSNWAWQASRHDRAQDEYLDHLSARVAAASFRSHRRGKEAAQANRRVAKDLEALSNRVDEFIEYTDLRFALQKFQDISAVRSNIERRFQSLAQGEAIAVPSLEDINGYWMPPAAHAVLCDLCDDAPSVAQSALDTARMRDRMRTELFLLSAGTSFERQHLCEPAAMALLRMPMALGESAAENPDTTVAAAWRLLWVRVAGGEFGTQAHEMLRARLAATAPRDQQAWLADARKHGNGPHQTLEDLRRSFESVMAIKHPPAMLGMDEIDAWREFVQELVEEGHGAERPLLERIRHIRSGGGEDGDSLPSWLQNTGTVAQHLRSDVFDSETPAPMRQLAMIVCADGLIALADQLRDDARQQKVYQQDVQVSGVTVHLTVDGPSADSRSKLEKTIRERYIAPSAAGSVATGLGLIVWPVISVVCFVVGQGMLGFFCLLAAGISGIAVRRMRRNAKEMTQARESAMGRSDAQLAKAYDALLTNTREAERIRTEADHAHDVFVKSIAPYSTRTP